MPTVSQTKTQQTQAFEGQVCPETKWPSGMSVLFRKCLNHLSVSNDQLQW